MIIPEGYIQDSIEVYMSEKSTKSQIIYLVVLIWHSLILFSLPFIYVDITVRGFGIIRPSSEKAIIKATVSEIVDSIFIKEGDFVMTGEPILKLNSDNLDYQIIFLLEEIKNYSLQIDDLNLLVKKQENPVLSSPIIRKEFNSYIEMIKRKKDKIKQTKLEHHRNIILFRKNMISKEEYEKSKFHLTDLINELKVIKKEQISKWQSEINFLEQKLKKSRTSYKQKQNLKQKFWIKSPIKGTVEQFSGIYPSSYIQSDQLITVISPDAKLYVESFVTTKDIGFIKLGMQANIQVDAFDYNEWGTIPAYVKDISSDIIKDENGNYIYKVKCELERDYLELKNGTKAFLKKGMLVACHFKVTKRSLFNLLYQKVDNCLNPRQN